MLSEEQRFRRWNQEFPLTLLSSPASIDPRTPYPCGHRDTDPLSSGGRVFPPLLRIHSSLDPADIAFAHSPTMTPIQYQRNVIAWAVLQTAIYKAGAAEQQGNSSGKLTKFNRFFLFHSKLPSALFLREKLFLELPVSSRPNFIFASLCYRRVLHRCMEASIICDDDRNRAIIQDQRGLTNCS